MRRSRDVIEKALLSKSANKEFTISKVCRGIIDIAYGRHVLNDMKKRGLVEFEKEKNIKIVRVKKKGLNMIGFKKTKLHKEIDYGESFEDSEFETSF